MAEVDDAVLLDLESLFQNVAFRANRLAEWIDLELRSRMLVRSIIRLSRDADRAYQQLNLPPGQTPDHNIWSQIRETWTTCWYEDLPDLQSLRARIRYLHLPLESTDGGDASPDIVTWIDELTATATSIHGYVGALNAEELQRAARNLKQSLDLQLRRHQSQVQYEIRQLSTLSSRLEDKIDAITPEINNP